MVLGLQPLGGASLGWRRESLQAVIPAGGGRVQLSIWVDAAPLTPLPLDALLREARGPRRAFEALAFLAYREKLMAGSPRFLTYFGRDTLLTLLLLGDEAHPRLWDAALRSVLVRIGPGGEVAHEEALGADAMEATEAWSGPLRLVDGFRTRLDYAMVDDDFLLLPALRQWLLDEGGRPKAFAQEWLDRPLQGGMRMRDAIAANLSWVRRAAAPYAAHPNVHELIALREGMRKGDWRDSDEGLGGGRYPYSINAAMVPAALAAAIDLCGADALKLPACEDREALIHAHEVWQGAWRHFRVERSAEEAARARRTYARALGLPLPTGSESSPLRYEALSLDAQGKAMEVMHSDGGLRLWLGRPSSAELKERIAYVSQRFPRGLMSPLGMFVANAAYLRDEGLRAQFSPRHYHGAVVWSWQLVLWLRGLEKQLARADHPPELQEEMRALQGALRRSLESVRTRLDAELWSWRYERQRGWIAQDFVSLIEPMAPANPVQLWSATLLSLGKRLEGW